MPTPQPSRRTLAKGAAWSVPAISLASTSPAMAASQPCATKTATWVSASTPTSVTGNGVSATSSALGGTVLRTTNFTPTVVSNGSQFSGQQWLMLDQAGSNASGQRVTLTFPQAIYCPVFYINDIDSQFTTTNGRYRDQVVVTGFTSSTKSADVTVSGGTAASATTATSTTSGVEWDNTTSARGLAKFAAKGPVTSITLTYSNTNATGDTSVNTNQQQVYISPISYSTAACAC